MTAGQSFAVGVDIGGTNMSAAVVQASDGAVVAHETIATLSIQGADDGMRRLLACIDRVVQRAPVGWDAIAGIGVGCTGPLDIARGLIQNPFTLPGWDDLPIVPMLAAAFDKPVLLLNDAHAAALGEHQIGAGRGTQHMIYLTISTGIGSGLILDGRLYQGRRGLAGEVGHHAIALDGIPCYCGRHGCWEMYASGPAIATRAQTRVTPDSPLWAEAAGQPETITARMVGAAAQRGDALAIELLHETGMYIGVGIANLINTLAPEMVVLGGGVMQSHTFLLPALHATIQQQHYAEHAAEVHIVLAQLGLHAGVIGAAFGILRMLSHIL